MNLFARLRARFGHQETFRELLFHSALGLTVTAALSYFFGLVRDLVFAHTFGASRVLDIYNAAFVIPDLFLALFVTGALSAAFVPLFTELREKSMQDAWKYTNQILTYALLVLGIAAIIFAIFLPSFTDFLVPGFNEEEKATYVYLTRLMLISPCIFTFSNALGNALISLKEFFWYGLSPVLYNFGIICGALFLVPYVGDVGLVIGTLFGALLHLGIRLPFAFRHGFRPGIYFGFTSQIRQTIVLMLPQIVQVGMLQIMLLWFVRLASELPAGSGSMYSFARNFQSMPVSLIGIAISLAAFARFTELAAEKKFGEFKKVLIQKTLMILFITCGAALVLSGISYLLIDLLLGHGKFDQAAVQTTAALLSVYCLAVPTESLMHLLSRAHYSLKNTLRPSIINITGIALIIITSQMMLPYFGLFSIPLSFSLGLFVQVILLKASIWQLLNKRAK